MDVLANILNVLRLRSTVYCWSQLSFKGWRLNFEALPCAAFHVMVQGTARLMLADGGHLCLAAGEVVVLPHGDAHIIDDQADATVVVNINLMDDVAGGCQIKRYGEQDIGSIIICGMFQLQQTKHPLLDLLPSVVHFSREQVISGGLAATLDSIEYEANRNRLGASVLLTRLADVLFVQMMRIWLEDHQQPAQGWLAGLRDPYIALVLAAIHENPAYDWTLASLAEVAMMSRALFASRFSAIVGISPMQYVTEWRMIVASQLLSETPLTMVAIAEAVGYQTEAAFSKAFKRVMEISPGRYRQQSVLLASHKKY